MNQNQDMVPAGSSAKRRWVNLLLGGAVLTIIVMIAIINLRGDARSATGDTFLAQRGDMMITVTEGGSIRARTSISYICEVERRVGDITILNIVPAGTYITQQDVDNGKVLIELDSSALKERLVRAKLDLATEKENLTSAKETHEIQVLQNESDIADGQLKLRFALLALQKYMGNELSTMLIKDVNTISNLTEYVAPFQQMARNDPNILEGSGAGQELKKLNDEIVMAQGSLANAQATFTGTQRLYGANYVSTLDMERDRLNVVNRKFALENALVNLNLFLRYDFPKNVEQYVSDYREAWRQLQRTYSECRSRIAHAQGRLTNAQEQVADEAGTVAWYERLIEKCTIRAKAPGLVIYGTGTSSDSYSAMIGRGSGGGGSGIIAPGETVYQRQTLISVPDTASMIAEINVHETEVDKVWPGQTAQIVMDAFPDRVLQGKVIEVAPLPDEQRGFMNPDLKVYKTLVSIDGNYDFLKTRMSCKVEIFVKQLKDVIFVPIQVVANRRGLKIVYVVNKNGDSEERQVKTGMFNDTFVEICEGLQEGEKVLLNPPLFMDVGIRPSFELDHVAILEPNEVDTVISAKHKNNTDRSQKTSKRNTKP